MQIVNLFEDSNIINKQLIGGMINDTAKVTQWQIPGVPLRWQGSTQSTDHQLKLAESETIKPM